MPGLFISLAPVRLRLTAARARRRGGGPPIRPKVADGLSSHARAQASDWTPGPVRAALGKSRRAPARLARAQRKRGGPSADGLTPHARAKAPTGARRFFVVAIPDTQKSCNFCWNCFFAVALGKRRLANGQTAASAKNSRSGPPPHNDRVCHLEHSPCHPERSEGSLEWCRAFWRVTKILHLRFRMTGHFASQ